MNFIDDNRKVDIEIISVESIPCDLVGKKAVFGRHGIRLTAPWDFPWPMDWIEPVIQCAVIDNSYVSQTKVLKGKNPEEPDQEIQFKLRSYIDLKIGDIPSLVSEIDPQRTAFVNSSGSRRYSYESFNKNVMRIAGGLISIGVNAGDKTAVWAVNSPEYAIAQFGTSLAGSVMAPVNAYEKEHYVENILNKSQASTLILQVGTKATENIEILYRICPELCDSIPGKLKSERLPRLKNVIVISEQEYPGTYRWSDILSLGTAIDEIKIKERSESISIDDPVHMIFTSGTTGAPKGVILTHGNLVENAYAMKNLMKLTAEDVMCIQAPMFHCFGCVAGSLSGVMGGCSMVMVDKYRSEITLSLIKRERCTVVSGVPVMFNGLARVILSGSDPGEDLNIRTGIIAGASAGVNLSDDLKKVLKIMQPVLSYGLTEASPCVSSLSVDDGSDISGGNVGKAIPGVDVKIVDPITKTPLADSGLKGEIAVSGYNIMQGYFDDPEETEKVLTHDGWLYTGDMGYMDYDGNLFIVDRFKDIIIRNGENIAPGEIEKAIEEYPGVDKVSVVGATHPECGEELFAFLTAKKDVVLAPDAVKKYLEGRIAKYKIPRFICQIDSFPLTETGKIQKDVLRKRAKQLSIEGIPLEFHRKSS